MKRYKLGVEITEAEAKELAKELEIINLGITKKIAKKRDIELAKKVALELQKKKRELCLQIMGLSTVIILFVFSIYFIVKYW